MFTLDAQLLGCEFMPLPHYARYVIGFNFRVGIDISGTDLEHFSIFRYSLDSV